jgi:PAS domain S-box-containing protein
MNVPNCSTTNLSFTWDQLAELIDNVGIIRLDAAGRIVTWNPGAERLTGYLAIDVEGCLLAAYLDTDCDHILVLPDAIAVSPAGSVDQEHRLTRADGRPILVGMKTTVLRNEGRVSGYGVILQELPATPGPEERLRAIATRYETLLDHATDAFFVHSYGGVILDLNQKACDCLGYSRKELLGQVPTLFSLQLTSDRLQWISSQLDLGLNLTYESLLRRKDGTTFPVEVRIRPFWLEGDRFSVTMIRDLSMQQQADRSLREKEERYRLALDTVELGTWQYDIAEAVVSMDLRSQSHWGEGCSEIGLESLLARIHPEDLPAARRNVFRSDFSGSTEETLATELRVILSEGDVCWLSIRAVIHFEGEGENRTAVSLVGTTLDVTKPRSAAVALKAQNRVLEQIAAGESLDRILEEITILIEAQIPGSLCSILLLDPDGCRLRTAAGHRLPAEYCALVDGIRIGPDMGSCGTAAWLRQPVMVADIHQDPRWEKFVALAEPYGLQSCWSVPIFAAASKDRADTPLVGTFAIYRRFPSSPDQRSISALETASHLAGMAVGCARAVQEIRESHARYAMISEITRSVTFGMSRRPDNDWQIDWVRPHFGLLSGHSQEEINATGWRTLFPPEDLPRIYSMFDRIRAGHAVKEELRYVTKSGEILDVQVYVKLLDDGANDRPPMIIGGLLDITEFKSIEKALRTSEERFQLAMLGANDGLWDWNLKNDQIFLSDRWKTMLGYRPDELTDSIETWFSLLHPDDAKNAMSQVQTFLKTCLDKYEIEYRLRHKDGTYRNILSRGVLSRENGEPVRAVGTHRDLTDRRIAEQALQRSEEFLRRAQMMANMGSWTFDLQTRVFECSQECVRIYGISGRSCTLAEWERLIHHDDLPLARQSFQAALSGTPLEQEYRLIVRGKTIWVSVKASLETNTLGKTLLLMGVTQDVSSRRRLEEQLRHSQKMEAFGQLAGGVAHDFNNLLTVINGFSEILLQETGPDHPGYHCSQQILEAGERAAVLTRQLLTLSRRQFTEPRVIDLNQVIVRSESMLRRLIGEDILIETILAKQLPTIKADAGQIDQVLLNLVVNARDAMPNGGRLTIETSAITISNNIHRVLLGIPDGDYVEISVCDTGLGMTEDVKARIFEPFFSTKGVGKGTGLGLATVYGIVKQNEGFISVDSHPGHGTTFHILLPVCYSEIVPTSPTVTSQRRSVGGSETILLAEDESCCRPTGPSRTHVLHAVR